jgi:hypothetical protein
MVDPIANDSTRRLDYYPYCINLPVLAVSIPLLTTLNPHSRFPACHSHLPNLDSFPFLRLPDPVPVWLLVRLYLNLKDAHTAHTPFGWLAQTTPTRSIHNFISIETTTCAWSQLYA